MVDGARALRGRRSAAVAERAARGAVRGGGVGGGGRAQRRRSAQGRGACAAAGEVLRGAADAGTVRRFGAAPTVNTPQVAAPGAGMRRTAAIDARLRRLAGVRRVRHESQRGSGRGKRAPVHARARRRTARPLRRGRGGWCLQRGAPRARLRTRDWAAATAARPRAASPARRPAARAKRPWATARAWMGLRHDDRRFGGDQRRARQRRRGGSRRIEGVRASTERSAKSAGWGGRRRSDGYAEAHRLSRASRAHTHRQAPRRGPRPRRPVARHPRSPASSAGAERTALALAHAGASPTSTSWSSRSRRPSRTARLSARSHVTRRVSSTRLLQRLLGPCPKQCVWGPAAKAGLRSRARTATSWS